MGGKSGHDVDMLVAHLAPALVAKALRPEVNLPLAMGLCLLVDLVHALLVLLGLERLGADERFSHTLLAVALLTVATVAAALIFGANAVDALIYGGCVLSHWVFDLINRRRMHVTPWGGWIPGVGLHERDLHRGHHWAFAVELGLVCSSAAIFAASRWDGRMESLTLPGLILAGMLTAEIAYFRVYAPILRRGQHAENHAKRGLHAE